MPPISFLLLSAYPGGVQGLCFEPFHTLHEGPHVPQAIASLSTAPRVHLPWRAAFFFETDAHIKCCVTDQEFLGKGAIHDVLGWNTAVQESLDFCLLLLPGFLLRIRQTIVFIVVTILVVVVAALVFIVVVTILVIITTPMIRRRHFRIRGPERLFATDAQRDPLRPNLATFVVLTPALVRLPGIPERHCRVVMRLSLKYQVQSHDSILCRVLSIAPRCNQHRLPVFLVNANTHRSPQHL